MKQNGIKFNTTRDNSTRVKLSLIQLIRQLGRVVTSLTIKTELKLQTFPFAIILRAVGHFKGKTEGLKTVQVTPMVTNLK